MRLLLAMLGLSLANPTAGFPVPCPLVQQPSKAVAAPNTAYSQLVDEAAQLFRRIALLPDSQAAQIMRKEGPALLARARQVKPAYIRWLRTLTPALLQAEKERLAMHPGMIYFSGDMDPKLGAKAQRNPAFGQQCLDLMEALAEGV